MNEHLLALDLATAGDAVLVAEARTGNRAAFGLLYFRHHAAAWRMACIASGFSPDAEVALIEGFTTMFSVVPEEMDGVSIRPALLACVRQAVLDRAGRAKGPSRLVAASARPGAPGRDELLLDELVLGDLEHHGVRAALLALPERRRSALWLSTVEAMTPTEVGAILDLEPAMVSAIVAGAGAELREASLESHQQCEVRAGCRFTVDHLGPFLDGLLSHPEQVLVETHVDRCAPCRMRRVELDNVPATLAAAAPVAPLLGGECQRHWLGRVDSGEIQRAACAGRRRRGRRLLPALARPLLALPALAIVATLAGVALSLSRPPTPGAPSASKTALVSPIVRAQLPGLQVVQVAPPPPPAPPAPTASQESPVDQEALSPAGPIELVVATSPAEPATPSALFPVVPAVATLVPPVATLVPAVALPPALAANPIAQDVSGRVWGRRGDKEAKAAKGSVFGDRLQLATTP